MPEGPELHLAALMVNRECGGLAFSSPVLRSEVAKSPEVKFDSENFTLRAEAKGKEVKVHLQDSSSPTLKTHLLFRFGMTGCFKLVDSGEEPKHAHLRMKSRDGKRVFCFVDSRRFGRWEVEGRWGGGRGPDPMDEYEAFRSNVLSRLDESAFNRAICEVMLNQNYFNGVGNYLRAEILFRCGIRPFDRARDVLQPLVVKKEEEEEEEKPSKKKKKNKAGEFQDVLAATSKVMAEVLNLHDGQQAGYVVNADPEARAAFSSWLRCYDQDGMRKTSDSNGRTVWFQGEAGTLAPKLKAKKAKGSATKKKKKAIKRENPVKEEVKLEEEEADEKFMPLQNDSAGAKAKAVGASPVPKAKRRLRKRKND